MFIQNIEYFCETHCRAFKYFERSCINMDGFVNLSFLIKQTKKIHTNAECCIQFLCIAVYSNY